MRMSRGKRKRGRENPQADSLLSLEPNEGLHPTTLRSWPWAETKSWVFPIKAKMYFFPLATFKVFFFFMSLVFRSLIMMCLGRNFFGFILFVVYTASWVGTFRFQTSLGNFSAIISSGIFLPLSSFLFLSGFKFCLIRISLSRSLARESSPLLWLFGLYLLAFPDCQILQL